MTATMAALNFRTRSVSEKLDIVNQYLDRSSTPIQMVPLAQELGIRVYKTEFPDQISGRIERDEKLGGESGFACFINAGHHRVRRRFTVAHEIAHYVLHEDQIGDGVFDDAMYRSGLSNQTERQANEFAADLLMPWSKLNGAIAELGNDVNALAARFDVSRDAMKIRLGFRLNPGAIFS